MTDHEHLMEYRAYYPHQLIADEIVGPVSADSPEAAAAMLGCDMRVLQQLVNGAWVWVL